MTGEPMESISAREPAGAVSEEVRRLDVDDLRWVIEAVGTARTGVGGDAGAILLRLRFTSDGAGLPPRECWVVATTLEDLSDAALLSAFREAHAPSVV